MQPRDRVFYPALAILISATGFAGFSFTYFGPVIRGEYPPAGWALHVHGWSFFLWLLLLPLQAMLIAWRHRSLHMILGRSSAALVVLMTLALLLSGFHPLSLPAGTLSCSVFIIIGMAYDRLTRRAVHPAYWIGLIALFAVELPLPSTFKFSTVRNRQWSSDVDGSAG